MAPNNIPAADAQTATPMSEQQLAEIRALAARAVSRPFLFSDCEGELKVWALSALKHVHRDAEGTVTGWSEPGSYRAADLVATVELDMDTWDPGEDRDDDQRRTDVGDLVAAREAIAALLAEVDRLRLKPHERLVLRVALDMADEAIADSPIETTDADRAAMAKLRALSTGPTVAYRNPWQPGVLLCVEHGEGWEGMKPLSVEDLPNGGTCTAGDPANPDDVCGRNVLAAEAGDRR